MKKIIFICLISLTACSEHRECPVNTIEVSRETFGFGGSIPTCCNVSVDIIMKEIIKCNESVAKSVTHNTKYQAYEEIAWRCDKIVKDTYCQKVIVKK